MITGINKLITMKNKFKYIIFLIGMFSLFMVACEDNIDPIIEKLDFDRVFSPIDLTARIRNMTTVELSWSLRDDADSYVVEFSEDSLEFNAIIKTVNVAPNEVPISVTFDGETQYSARVKGVSASGIQDSKWTEIAFKTDPENIFEPMEDGDLQATIVTLRWPAGSDVTNFVIVPGNIDRPITDQEKADGMATITGLTGETQYTVTLYKGTKHRGEVTFTTLVDIGNATAVYPEDDLPAMIAAANDGDVLALFPGEYGTDGVEWIIEIDKSITIRGVYPYNKPLVHANFDLKSGAGNVEFRDLELAGGNIETTVFDFVDADATYGTLSVSGCTIRDYTRQFVYGSKSNSTIAAVNIDNCIVQNFITSGGDFLDFRSSYVTELNVTNSTFVNCAQGRDFIRIDAASGLSGTGLTTTVLIDHCTIYASATGGKRITYIRFDANVIDIKNNLFAETDANYSNQVATSIPSFSNNYYFNAGELMTSGDQADTGGTVADPGFVDAANGDFTITNQTLIDNNVGDPRWIQ